MYPIFSLAVSPTKNLEALSRYDFKNIFMDGHLFLYFCLSHQEKLVDQNRFISIDNNYSKPSNFSVFQLNINEVDLLKLEKPVHKRYIWKKNDDWKCIQLNH